jgi:hypothetical protein
MAAVTMAVAVRDGEASTFSSRRLSATPKWFSGVNVSRIQKVARDTQLLELERATLVRGGGSPEETSEETSEDPEAVVEVQDLYLPGLVETIITRTNKVCRVGSVASIACL